VSARGVTKRFRSKIALDRVDLTVAEGTVCGLLGPNGAGKTTLVRIAATLLAPDAGHLRVCGLDVVSDAARVRDVIGLAGQYAAVDEILGGRENLRMFGRLYRLGSRRANARADELLERFALTDAADRPVKTYSGGMRRRLDLAASLIIAPRVLFLDEPTTGIDPGARLDIWDMVADLVREGVTVILTTQYLDEADRLADQIVVLNRGAVAAAGTPLQLKAALGGATVDVVLRDRADAGAAAEAVTRAVGAVPQVAASEGRLAADVLGDDGTRALIRVAAALSDAGIPVADLALRQPTLDEVFLHLTRVPAAAEVPA
jgi:ABC-2 type transport system ATP-binding protein